MIFKNNKQEKSLNLKKAIYPNLQEIYFLVVNIHHVHFKGRNETTIITSV